VTGGKNPSVAGGESAGLAVWGGEGKERDVGVGEGGEGKVVDLTGGGCGNRRRGRMGEIGLAG
jgi:hypothetical protein